MSCVMKSSTVTCEPRRLSAVAVEETVASIPPGGGRLDSAAPAPLAPPTNQSSFRSPFLYFSSLSSRELGLEYLKRLIISLTPMGLASPPLPPLPLPLPLGMGRAALLN